MLKVMIIRHGEKPEVKQEPPFGVSKDGEADWDSLTVRGWQRAGALASLFVAASLPALAPPQLIYASKRRPDSSAPGADVGSKSKRPRQTITPLANRLGIEPILDFGKGEEEALVAHVQQQEVPVLVAWQHEGISTIARRIVAASPPPQMIPEWPSTRFDMIWVLDRPTEKGHPWRFTQVPQRLLKGDSDSAITSSIVRPV